MSEREQARTLLRRYKHDPVTYAREVLGVKPWKRQAEILDAVDKHPRVAVRSGQHCAHPLMQFYGVAATCRASFAFYNTHDEIERFVAALIKVRRLLG